MGNKRDDLQNEGDAEVGVGIAGILGILGLAVGGIASAVHNNKEEKETQQRLQQIQQQIAECNQKINDIDREIDNYRSRFMGSILYSNEIDQLKEFRQQWVNKRDRLNATLKTFDKENKNG